MTEIIMKKERPGFWILTCPDCGKSREVKNATKYRAVKSGDTRCHSCAFKLAKDPRKYNTNLIRIIQRESEERWIVECPECERQRSVHICQLSYYRKNGHSLCRACAITGERHWRYSEFTKRKRFYQRSEWYRIRRIVRKRDVICQFPSCDRHQSTDGRALSVHHIIPMNDNGSHDLDNLIALCSQHHTWCDQNLEIAMPILQSIAIARKRDAGN